uniref:Transmembrane protein n=1 Tax=Panagrellus redivivus TaxID=6233 RepID=A0A7E4VCJ2_PANRE
MSIEAFVSSWDDLPLAHPPHAPTPLSGRLVSFNVALIKTKHSASNLVNSRFVCNLNPYYVVYNKRWIHVDGCLITSIVIMVSYFWMFRLKYPKSIRSTLRLLAALMGLKDPAMTNFENQLYINIIAD